MKKFLSLIIVLVLIIRTLPVFASNWNKITEEIYIDTDSIEWDSFSGKRFNSPVYNYWAKYINNHKGMFKEFEIYYKKRISKSLVKETVFCNSKSMSVSAIYLYDEQNNVVDSQEGYNNVYFSVVPDSISEIRFDFVCQYGNKKFNLK